MAAAVLICLDFARQAASEILQLRACGTADGGAGVCRASPIKAWH